MRETKEKKNKKTSKEIVEENRKKIVDKLIENMEKGYIFSEWAWNRKAFIPQNAVTGVTYQGINRLNLSLVAIANKYDDPRWITYKKADEMGYKVKPDSKGVLCEKWIWEKRIKVINEETGEVEKDDEGREKYKTVELERPIINFFYLFNATQLEGIPPYQEVKELEKTDILTIADDFIVSSECPIEEKFQESAYYSPLDDKIILPPRKYFKSDEAFLGTLLHEMSHSTGNENRLNRDIINRFGTEKYALEELTAELSCVFLEAELDKDIDFSRQDHINYFNSWIQELKNEPNELYKVCANASKSCSRLMENYEKVRTMEKNQIMEDIEIDEAI